MFQIDFFTPTAPSHVPHVTSQLHNLPSILARLARVCERPRYAFIVLQLIAQASAKTGFAGPYVIDGDQRLPVREWLSEAMAPMAQRDPTRAKLPSPSPTTSRRPEPFRAMPATRPHSSKNTSASGSVPRAEPTSAGLFRNWSVLASCKDIIRGSRSIIRTVAHSARPSTV